VNLGVAGSVVVCLDGQEGFQRVLWSHSAVLRRPSISDVCGLQASQRLAFDTSSAIRCTSPGRGAAWRGIAPEAGEGSEMAGNVVYRGLHAGADVGQVGRRGVHRQEIGAGDVST